MGTNVSIVHSGRQTIKMTMHALDTYEILMQHQKVGNIGARKMGFLGHLEEKN